MVSEQEHSTNRFLFFFQETEGAVAEQFVQTVSGAVSSIQGAYQALHANTPNRAFVTGSLLTSPSPTAQFRLPAPQPRSGKLHSK